MKFTFYLLLVAATLCCCKKNSEDGISNIPPIVTPENYYYPPLTGDVWETKTAASPLQSCELTALKIVPLCCTM